MKDHNYSAIFGAGKRLGFMLLMLVFTAVAAWRIGTVPSVAVQAKTAPAHAKTKVNPEDGLTYIWIPAGSFQMGCSVGDTECTADDSPAHKVTFTKGYWIGQTEVTQAAYKKIASMDASKFQTGVDPSKFKGDKLPVEHVTWNDAVAYCKSVGMRLPTDAEWEDAARGGSTAARYGALDDIAWYKNTSGGTTHEVGTKQPNGYGLYDVIGSVPEWVSDWSGPYSAADAVDPQGPDVGTPFASKFRTCADCKVLRGGAIDFEPTRSRISYRHWLEPDDPKRNHTNGMRCASN